MSKYFAAGLGAGLMLWLLYMLTASIIPYNNLLWYHLKSMPEVLGTIAVFYAITYILRYE
jgi:hypothetical protein